MARSTRSSLDVLRPTGAPTATDARISMATSSFLIPSSAHHSSPPRSLSSRSSADNKAAEGGPVAVPILAETPPNFGHDSLLVLGHDQIRIRHWCFRMCCYTPLWRTRRPAKDLNHLPVCHDSC